MEMLPDDKVEALLRQYRASLPEKSAALRAALSAFESQPRREGLADLRMLVHRLAGSAPLYGYVEFGKHARVLMHEIDELNLPPPVVRLADLHEHVMELANAMAAEAQSSNRGVMP
jgi:HPt (histidine-containing phosphotransfer) domain-containing protein